MANTVRFLLISWLTILAACGSGDGVPQEACRNDLFSASSGSVALLGSGQTVEAVIGSNGGVLSVDGATIDIEPDPGRANARVTLESLRCSPKLGNLALPDSTMPQPTTAISPVYRIGPPNLTLLGGLKATLSGRGEAQRALLFSAETRNTGAVGQLGTLNGDLLSGHIGAPGYFFLAGPSSRCVSGADGGC